MLSTEKIRVAFLMAGLAIMGLSGCDLASDTSGEGAVTLYRNSMGSSSMRIHFSTFDAEGGVNYNLSNCQFSARSLNANIAALNTENENWVQVTGFWCEIGPYKETGLSPATFDSEFPSVAH